MKSSVAGTPDAIHGNMSVKVPWLKFVDLVFSVLMGTEGGVNYPLQTEVVISFLVPWFKISRARNCTKGDVPRPHGCRFLQLAYQGV